MTEKNHNFELETSNLSGDLVQGYEKAPLKFYCKSYLKERGITCDHDIQEALTMKKVFRNMNIR